MDRACAAGPGGAGRGHRRGRPGGSALRRTRGTPAAILALAAALACETLAPDLDQVIALEVVLPDSGFVEVGDTLFPRARALNGRGDSVAATVYWASLDTATVTVVDSLTGATLGRQPPSGRIQARIDNLRSNPVTITVQPALDSAAADGATRDTVTLTGTTPDSLSDSLRVRVFATPATAQSLVRRTVVFVATTYPSGSGSITLVPRDTARTSTAGIALAQVRLLSGTVPDSVVVSAQVRRPDGTPVSGAPITFVVEVRP